MTSKSKSPLIKEFSPFSDHHVWLNKKSAKLEVWPIGDCPYIPVVGFLTETADYVYLGSL